jgi:prophage regulatory protein
MIPKIIRRAEIEEQLGLARSTIYQMVADGEFPKPVKLGRRAVGWRAEEVESWFNKMQEASND